MPGLGGGRLRDAGGVCRRSHSNAHASAADRDRRAFADARARGIAEPHCRAGPIAHGRSDTNRAGHTHRNAYGNACADTNPHAYRHADVGAHGDACANLHAGTHGDAHSGSHAHTLGNARADTNAYRHARPVPTPVVGGSEEPAGQTGEASAADLLNYL